MLNSDQAHAGSCASLLHNFVQRGWSIIPLRGTGENGKAPALPSWQRYQSHPPTPAQVTRWLADSRWTAYGIICGKASGLVVLDFDEKAAYDHFCLTFPTLTHTLTVRTGGRGGYHLYYRITYPVSSQKIIGGDLVAEGKYVVAPGSVINGKSWEIVNAIETPLPLKPTELEAIRKVFGLPAAPHPPNNTNITPTSTEIVGIQGFTSSTPFVDRYQQRVQQTAQRNHSLFIVACQMRDARCPIEEALSTLAPVHAHTPTAYEHPRESYASRYREAVSTIRSAYQYQIGSQPQIPTGQEIPQGISCLPNALREKLLSMPHGVPFLRTIEGLTACGVQPGTTLGIEELCRKLEGIVGQYSIKYALSFLNDTMKPEEDPPHTPQTEVDRDQADKNSNPPIVVLGGKNRRLGFVMPRIADLCAYFECDARQGDALGLEELCSVKLYRAALHRALVERRPGVYSREWQAQRLGTSARTIRTYDRAAQLNRIARYAISVISWQSLEHLPLQDDEFTSNGLFLEDEAGNRYPPYREVAAKLLKQGKHVLSKRQLPNYYYCGEIPPFYVSAAPLPADITERKRYLERSLYDLEHGLPVPMNRQGTPDTKETQGKTEKNQTTPYRGFYLQNEPMCAPLHTGRSVDRPLPIVVSNPEAPLRVPAGSRDSKTDAKNRVPTLSTLNPQPSALFRQPLAERDDEMIADALTMSIAGVKMTSARWIVHSLGRTKTWQLVRQIQALQAKGRITDPKKYLMRVVSNKLNGIDAPSSKPKPPNYHRPLNEAKAEAAAQRIHTEIPALMLANARKLVEVYGIQAADKTLRQIQWLTNPPARTGRTPYELRNPAGFFISAIRQAWRDLQPAQQGFFPPVPRFEGVKPRKPRIKPHDPLKEFMKLAKRGKQINWSYLEWRAKFHAEQGMVDPFQYLIDEWCSV